MDITIVDQVAAAVRAAQRILFITGAGLSADSGLPTYRGVSGLYNDEHCEDGIPIEEALSGPMFEVKPELTWRHMMRIEQACRGAAPNRGHAVIAGLEAKGKRVVVLTQNVDGLHARAGSTDVIDIHGDVSSLFCPACDWTERVDDYAHLAPTPKCPACGQVIRPRVILFGEMLDPDKVARLHTELEAGFDMVFTIGTSALFPYIVAPVQDALARGAPTVEINPGQTHLSEVVQFRLQAGAADALEAIDARL